MPAPKHKNKVTKMCKAISTAHRYDILYSLYTQGQLSVSELVKNSTQSQSLVSYNLKRLVEGGLVVFRKKGRTVHYKISSRGDYLMGTLNIAVGIKAKKVNEE